MGERAAQHFESQSPVGSSPDLDILEWMGKISADEALVTIACRLES